MTKKSNGDYEVIWPRGERKQALRPLAKRLDTLGHGLYEVSAIVGTHRTDREHARIRGREIGGRLDVSRGRQQRRGDEAAVRRRADERKQTGAFDVRAGAVLHVTQTHAGNCLVAENRTDLAVPDEAHVLPRRNPVDIITLCLERAAAHHDDLAAVFGENERLLHCAVAAADDNDFLAAKKPAIARRAPGQASTQEFLFTGHTEPAQRCTGSNDDGFGMIKGTLLIGQREAPLELNFRDARLHDPHPGLARILEEVHGQILAGEFSGDGNAVHFADGRNQTSEQRAALEQRDEPPESRGVARGGETGETAADDRDFT